MYVNYLDVFLRDGENLGKIFLEYLINIGDSRKLGLFLRDVFLVFKDEKIKWNKFLIICEVIEVILNF